MAVREVGEWRRLQCRHSRLFRYSLPPSHRHVTNDTFIDALAAQRFELHAARRRRVLITDIHDVQLRVVLCVTGDLVDNVYSYFCVA